MRRQIFEQIMIHRKAGKNLNFSGSCFFPAHIFFWLTFVHHFTCLIACSFSHKFCPNCQVRYLILKNHQVNKNCSSHPRNRELGGYHNYKTNVTAIIPNWLMQISHPINLLFSYRKSLLFFFQISIEEARKQFAIAQEAKN